MKVRKWLRGHGWNYEDSKMNRKSTPKPGSPTAMAEAWRTASADLQLEFVSPFTFMDEQGEPHTCSGLVVDVGGPKGTLIVSQHDEDPDADVAGAQLGFYTSALNPRYYEKYDRKRFMNTLLDWGWYGPIEKRPPWFK